MTSSGIGSLFQLPKGPQQQQQQQTTPTTSPNAKSGQQASQQPAQQQQQQQQQQYQPPRFVTQYGVLPLNMNAVLNLTTQSSQQLLQQPHGASQNKSSQHAASCLLSEEKLAQEVELGSIQIIRQFLSRTIEVFGLWKILDEHKFHFISTKLDKATQQVAKTILKLTINGRIFNKKKVLFPIYLGHA